MPVSEKQKGYSRKWDKDNMRTLATRVRTDVAEDFKKYCEEKVLPALPRSSGLLKLLWRSGTRSWKNGKSRIKIKLKLL